MATRNVQTLWRMWFIGYLSREIPRNPTELYAHYHNASDPLGARMREAVSAVTWLDYLQEFSRKELTARATEYAQSIVRRFRRVAA